MVEGRCSMAALVLLWGLCCAGGCGLAYLPLSPCVCSRLEVLYPCGSLPWEGEGGSASECKVSPTGQVNEREGSPAGIN